MNFHFTLSELCIQNSDDTLIPLHVADKLLHHIEIILPIRMVMQCPIWASQNSGYRSEAWERQHGRSGRSQHVFDGGGAIDWTTKENRLEELLDLLLQTEYKRVCWYPTKKFIHCDLKGDERQYFESPNGVDWVRK